MKLVRRAAKAGVKFGGYVKGSAHKGLTAYTDYGTKTVYVPHTQTDPILAMSDFVFELRNAMQAGKLSTTWSKAKKRQINAYQFAYNNVAIEVESALSTGLIWSQSPLRRRMGRRQRKKYDKANYLSMYLAYKSGKKTKDQLIKQALKRTYKSGIFRGWTVEKKFTEQYKSIPRP